jgi:hypothetical protein
MDNLTPTISYLPDGRPAPAVMTTAEVIEFLRLDSDKGSRTLKYYRDEGELTGIRLGRSVKYPLSEVMRFLNEKVNKTRNDGSTGQHS